MFTTVLQNIQRTCTFRGGLVSMRYQTPSSLNQRLKLETNAFDVHQFIEIF